MIDFLVTRNSKAPFGFSFTSEMSLGYYLHSTEKADSFIINDSKLIIIGDCINVASHIESIVGIYDVIHNLKGNFYAFYFQDSKLEISSSAFGLLPIYYLNDFSLFSSDVELIRNNSNRTFTENKRWIVNQLLFNYQFGDDTIFEEVSLFPAMSFLKLDGDGSKFIRYYSVKDEFLEKPIPWKKALSNLSTKFIETTKTYIPDEGSLISFTGGFDGRTLVSIASHFKKDFTTVSYGKLQNDDVYLPKSHSNILNVPYKLVDLNYDYSNNHYYDSAKSYLKKSSGQNGFLYAHTDYFSKRLKENNRYMITGIAGSELFRAFHSTGAATSKALVDLFKYDEYNKYKKSILSSQVFDFIDKNIFIDSIIDVIDFTWKYKILLTRTLDKNRALYVFVYEEIFRKFFGPWVKVQMHNIIVRTPYLDFSFFKDIIKTELSGAYSEFLTDNPLKRFKGQLLYCEVIRLTNKKLFWLITGKGYPPAFVNIPLLRPLLFIPFIKKRLSRKVVATDFDNLGIISGIKQSASQIENLEFPNYINKDKLILDINSLKNTDKESFRDNILCCTSLIVYLNSINNE
jgi:hypothetical protein